MLLEARTAIVYGGSGAVGGRSPKVELEGMGGRRGR